MSLLNVKTKGNSSPQGKAHVYFSCHPDDFDQYFNTICEDIFSTQNCAVYYESDWETPVDETEISEQLANMQLFIVLLTSKYLFRKCRARDFEYGFAVEHHIPVVPIVVESGLAQYFAECMNRLGSGYGDVQFLDRTSADFTEISYAEKLKKKLESILTGDELAERVRAAFDAYIFLSYRKMDRRYAGELMRLIHRIPYCRDIAIWYDEFLVPGERWNDAITEALNKSSLVTMAVTPSLTEPGNYIIEHEYPEAIKARKNVIPAELAPVDKDMLAKLFEGISSPVDGTNLTEMTKALQALATNGNNTSPEHKFLIGLAYLGGIDVERDSARAVQLIANAAEDGLPEAMEKLASMYNTGDGVEKNYYAAVQWQEKYCDVLEKTYADMSEDGKLVDALWLLGSMWEDFGRLSEARTAYTRMMEQAEKRKEHCNNPKSRRALSISYSNLGHIFQAEHNFSKAKEYFIKNLELNEEQVTDTGTVESLCDLGSSYGELGDLYYYFERDIIKAKEYFGKGLELGEKLVKETESVESRYYLDAIYGRMGIICHAEGNLSKAKEYFEKSLQVSEELSKEIGTIRAWRDVSISYVRMGDFYRVEGNLINASEYYKKSLEIREGLTKNIDTVQMREELSRDYGKLVSICCEEGDFTGAKEYCRKVLRLDEELSKETELAVFRWNLSLDCEKMGDICCEDENLKEVKEYYRKSLELREELVKEIGTVEVRCALNSSYGRMGHICLEEGNLKEAKEYNRKYLELSEKLLKNTGTFELWQELSIGYGRMGDIYHAEGNLKEAKEYYRKSLELCKKLSENSKTPETFYYLAISYYKFGNLGVRDRDMLNKAYDILCMLSDEYPGEQRYASNRDIIGRMLGIKR